ncbi:ubiquitin carboxyl-terminal hydrolase isozyme L3 isoform X2 [Bacillus rossius redtenbacheri]|uniref:ubiquitin carboxyl-terminal hydrolase isozyme L3 isoform X2 n=1 Tax=Bacillus rossius redtenbacheri TaxID=93214 RepID=UPI002FDDB7E4
MNKFLHNLGVPPKYELVDVYGLDEDVLATIPRPVLSVILLFPWHEKYQEYAASQEKEILERGQEVSEKVYFLKQVISNACGSIALVHSVGNNTNTIELEDGPLKQFLEDSATLSPEQRGEHLMLHAEGIISAHKEVALEGQTQAPDENVPVNFHFVAFVHKDGHLYELDGRKTFPINHGESSPDTLLEDAAKVCKQYMDRDPENIQFTVVALTGEA